MGQLPPDAGTPATFETVRPQIEKQRVAEVEEVHWFSTYRVHHRVADTFQVGRAFLLGDAAHVHSPVGGQGMNTGLGDAVNLGWKLAQAVRGHPAALASYGPERRPFALSLVSTTDRAFSGVVNPSPLARFIRTTLIPDLIQVLTRPRAVRRLAFLPLATPHPLPEQPTERGPGRSSPGRRPAALGTERSGQQFHGAREPEAGRSTSTAQPRRNC